ncbi:MAG: hypothetical protein ACOCUY_03775, partial [Verrucomicrobiota bacterium]
TTDKHGWTQISGTVNRERIHGTKVQRTNRVRRLWRARRTYHGRPGPFLDGVMLVPSSVFGIQHSTFNIQHSEFNIHHSGTITIFLQNAPFKHKGSSSPDIEFSAFHACHHRSYRGYPAKLLVFAGKK